MRSQTGKLTSAWALVWAFALFDASLAAADPANPILFAATVPVGGFGTSTAVFGDQSANPSDAPRGGDLVIRYPDGSLRFLTAEAGYGNSGLQGANAIAVRQPCVHWSGQKALFSMVVGAPTQQYQLGQYRWQIYEVSGLAQGETATIRYVDNQPAEYNNLSPIYGSDDRILFVSDRPRSGAAHHYPQRDEYESAPINAGIYSLDETTGVVDLLEHAPSGVSSLSFDSFGRVVFTKWDHLQRDQQGDAYATAATYEAFTWASEAADAATTTDITGMEVFPEPRTMNDPSYSPQLDPHSFNHFLPWEMNQDGTAEETLNHVGRHELGGAYTDGSFVMDPNLTYYVPPSLHANQLYIAGSAGLFHFREDPLAPGNFFTTYAQEFGTASGGTLMHLTGAPSVNAEDMVLTAITPTGNEVDVPTDTGYFRNPLPMSDGSLVAVHTPATGYAENLGTTANPNWNYAYRLRLLEPVMLPFGQRWAPTTYLTGGIVKSISFYTPDVLASYNGPLWEIDPVEVVARTAPPPRVSTVPAIEAGVFADEEVDIDTFRAYLAANQLALLVGRNVTQRDRADRHQPFNLQVPGGVSSIGAGGTIYDISHLQFFQADALRGYGDPDNPDAGRRLLARPMHEPGTSQAPGAPEGAVQIGADGSFAALVPARRAMTWQLTAPDGSGVVRERNWISFQSGEIRVCASCHGVNKLSQTGQSDPENEPQALHDLLAAWKSGGGYTPGPTPTATPAPGGGSGVCSSGIAIVPAKLKAKADPFKLVLKGSALVPKPWTGIAPDQNGVRVVVDDLLDQTVPGGAGWKVNAKGNRWIYRSADPAADGIRMIKIVDRSAQTDGLVSVIVKAGGAPRSLPAPDAVRADIVLGTADECAAVQFGGPAGTSPNCVGSAAKLKCR